MEEKKKKNRRSQNKYPALDPTLNLKSRSHLADYDYLDKLSDEEKQWLNDFSEGHNNANMTEGAKKIFKTDKEKKDCFNSNNARNRCILTRSHAGGTLRLFEDLKLNERLIEGEDEMIEEIDKILLDKIVNNSGNGSKSSNDSGDSSE